MVHCVQCRDYMIFRLNFIWFFTGLTLKDSLDSHWIDTGSYWYYLPIYTLVQTAPTALEPVTITSLSNEFVNLIAWQRGQNFGHGAENEILSEHPSNKHTGKAWNELNRISLINVREPQMQRIFNPPWSRILRQWAENGVISEHSPNKHSDQVWNDLNEKSF